MRRRRVSGWLVGGWSREKAQGRRIDPDLQVGAFVESLQKSSNILARLELDDVVRSAVDRAMIHDVTSIASERHSGHKFSIKRSVGNNLGHDVVPLIAVCAVKGHNVQDDLSELFHHVALNRNLSGTGAVKSCKRKEGSGDSIAVVFFGQKRVEEAIVDNHGRVENL